MSETTHNGVGATSASHEELRQVGKQVGKDLFHSNTNRVKAIGSRGIENKEDYKKALFEEMQDAEENYRCLSPFQHFAKELSERDDAEDAWKSYENGIYIAWEKEWDNYRVPILESKAEEIVEETLNEILDTVRIGEYRYDAGRALRLIDPIAFRQEILTYLDSEGLELA